MRNDLEQLDFSDWLRLIESYRAAHKLGRDAVLALRVENSQLSIARLFGGLTWNGHGYTYFEPRFVCPVAVRATSRA